MRSVKSSLEEKRNLSCRLQYQQQAAKSLLKEVLKSNIISSSEQVNKNIKLRKRNKENKNSLTIPEKVCRLRSSINALSQDDGVCEIILEESEVRVLKSSESCQMKWVDQPNYPVK